MTESGHAVRTTEAIHVHIIRAKNLRGLKGEVLTSYTKVELDGKSLGESSKVDSSAEIPAEYNFMTRFDCALQDGNFGLDELASKPVLVTFIEVLPKEKKQKEEKTSVLGQVTIDLLPLMLQPDLEVPMTLTLHPTAGSVLEAPDCPKAVVELAISVNEPLLDDDLVSQSNLLTVNVGSAYSLPEAWTASGSQYNYIVGLPVPRPEGKDPAVLFSNGAYKLAAEKEPSQRPVKWHNVPNVGSAAVFIPNNIQERAPLDEERGDFCDKDFVDFRREMETEKNRVTWDIERRCYLSPEVKSNFRATIGQTRLWPVEIMRSSAQPKPAGGGGGKKDKGQSEEEGSISYHGIAYVDLAPLLYPGVCKVAGAFRIHPFNEHELETKTKRKGTMADALTRIQSSTSRVTGASPSQKGKGSSQAGTMPPSKKGSAVKHADSTTDITDGVHNVDAVAYTDARCYIYLEFTLAQPLIPKRQPEELAQLVSEYIPPRPLITVPLGGAEKAVDDYHNQLSAVASMVLDEFQGMFGDDLISGGLDNSAMSQMKRKKELLYQLNSSGKYFAFKEQLKHSIVKIVREKYLHTSVFKSSELLQKFLSELFVFLIDEMHISLGKMLNASSQANDAPEPEIDICQLKKFAQEAEVNGDFDLALKYYKDCIAKEGKNPDHWFDYGTFCMLQEDYAKAKECFKESVALRQTYREGLLLYGIMCAMDSNFLEAEAIFERATTLTDSGDSLPPSLPWTIMALFYEIQGNEILSEHAFSEANKLNSIIAAGDLINNALINNELPEDEETAEDIEHGGSPQKTESGVTVVSKAEDSRPKSGATMSLASHSVLDHHETQAEHKGDGIADTSMPISLANVVFQTIFLQAANWLLDRKALKFAEIALSRELLAPQGGPSAEYYIALGRLHMVRKNFDEAKENLSKAVAMDIEHAEAWALLGHVHYLCGEVDDAQDCYERTISFVTNASEMHTVYLRLASIYLEKGKFSEAKRTYLLACKYSPTCNSWLGVGMACYRLDEISEAENALAEANILNNMNADVWAYLSLVCLKTERKIEAEQSYKYAIKLDLQDEHLLGEIRGLQKTIGFGDPSF